MSCGALWAASRRSVCGCALPEDFAAAPMASASTIWRSSMRCSSGDGCRPIPEAAQQRNLSAEPVGSRRRPAHQRRYWDRSKQGIVGGPFNTPVIQGLLKGVRPLEGAFGSFPTREKNAPVSTRWAERSFAAPQGRKNQKDAQAVLRPGHPSGFSYRAELGRELNICFPTPPHRRWWKHTAVEHIKNALRAAHGTHKASLHGCSEAEQKSQFRFRQNAAKLSCI